MRSISPRRRHELHLRGSPPPRPRLGTSPGRTRQAAEPRAHPCHPRSPELEAARREPGHAVEIRAWLERDPETGIGVLTGEVSGSPSSTSISPSAEPRSFRSQPQSEPAAAIGRSTLTSASRGRSRERLSRGASSAAMARTSSRLAAGTRAELSTVVSLARRASRGFRRERFPGSCYPHTFYLSQR